LLKIKRSEQPIQSVNLGSKLGLRPTTRALAHQDHGTLSPASETGKRRLKFLFTHGADECMLRTNAKRDLLGTVVPHQQVSKAFLLEGSYCLFLASLVGA
jgi:hypothetical protein